MNDTEKGKLLFEHLKGFLGLIRDSHATEEEQNAIWHEFLAIYTGKGLKEELKEKVMAKDKGRKEKKKPKQKK